MERPKIAYLSTFYPYRGGIAQFNALLYNELKLNADVTPYTFHRQYPKILFPGKTQMVTADDNAEKIDSIKVLDTINPISYHRAAQKLKKGKYDILLTKFWMPFFAPSLGYVAKELRKSGTKCISILDNVIPHEKRIGDDSLINYFLKHNDAFIVMSETVKNDLLKLKPDAKYELTPHPLYTHFGDKLDKTEARQKLGVPRDAKVLLFFGFIRKYKGLDILIETLKELPEEYFLIIAGECYGSYSEYDELIKQHSLENRVLQKIDYIADNETSLYFSASDVCVLPYRTATQSGIIGISYSFDLPVIATDKGGLREMIEPYNSGLLAPKATVNDIKYAIEKYFGDKMQDTLSQNVQKYKEQASWEKMANVVLNL